MKTHAAGISLAFAFSVSAYGATLSNTVVQIEASNANGTGSLEFDLSRGAWSGDIYTFSDGQAVTFTDNGGGTIATINDVSLYIEADPIISLNFSVSAGAVATNFTVTSAFLGFGAISPVHARASAGLSVTDQNGDGAILTGAFAGNTKSYRAMYNGMIPAATLFTELVDNASVASFSTDTSDEASPAVGFTPLGVPVTSMQTEYAFTLSPFDSAAGTSTFVIQEVPEPTSIAMLTIAMLALTRRRRAA